MAPRVRALIAADAGHAQVTALRSRAAARRYLADPATVTRAPAQGAASHEDRR
jgi:hypothetical protein